MSFHDLLERNRAFAATGAWAGLGIMPRQLVMVLTCLDPRVDPAVLLGLDLGDAPVLRNAGGRVTDAVVADVSFIGMMGELGAVEGRQLEVAVIHHTQCGTAVLSDPAMRARFAERMRMPDDVLAAQAVVDPQATVRRDVQQLLTAPQASERLLVSGHVYDVTTGLVETVVPATAVRHDVGVAS